MRDDIMAFFSLQNWELERRDGASGPTVYIVRSAKIFNFLARDPRSKKGQQMKKY
jgi:hypothetical protein